ncbi:uncharacterized protein LOC126906978 [Daktulosphaira vitifoliae]|uniref:uncharacterized protein LOC126906978 n=1 Tax=Daktulosphaira vitifoliae TaxID=58002 RepID=UPI0021A9F174|nr:uncharacterized protein LOC126906978 [Daktulosphaira vitifoliae]
MIYKTYSFVLIFVIDFYFGDVFGNIILIGEEGVMDIIHRTDKDDYCNDAKMITIPGCYKSSKVLKCGPLNIVFVNKKKVFAEIDINYFKRGVKTASNKKTIKITFGENNIILNNEKYKYKYNEVDINKLQSSIKNLDSKIEINIIKIYESNLSSNRTLAHSTVYDKNIKSQLNTIENLSLWKYAKEEKVPIASTSTSTQSNITLEDFINNSTTYNKNVAFTIKEALKIIDNRTFKYAFLLVVYVYRTLLIHYDAKIKWELVKKCFKLLRNAQIKNKEINNILYDLRIDFNIFEPDKAENCKQIIKNLMEKYSKLFTSTSPLSQDNLIEYTFEGFPKPHENDDIPYAFETIPTELSIIMEKLEKIFKLIETEYSTFEFSNINM